MNPERILRELQEHWSDKARDEAESGGVLKACAMTLAVMAENPEDAMRVHETMAMLMHSHPSRAIVLSPGGAEDGPEARVFSECWKPLGGTRQICAEGIAIAREMLLAVRNMVQGAQISAPQGRYSSAVDVLEALGASNKAMA